MGATVLRKIQIGAETTAGTLVSATTVMSWPYGATLNDERTIVNVEEASGQAVPFAHSYQPAAIQTVEVPDQPATFEQCCYWFEAGLEKITTAGVDTGGTGKIRAYDYANAAAPTIRTYTIEGSSGQATRAMTYGFVETFTISGASDEAIMMSGTWRGRYNADITATTAQIIPAINERMLFNKATFYLDAAAGTIGTTQKTNLLLGFSFDVPTGFKPVTTADGSNQFSLASWQPDEGPASVTGELIVRHNADGETLYDAAVAGTVKLIRIQSLGSALTIAGSSHTYKTARIDAAIEFTEVPSLDSQDSYDTYTLPFRVVDDSGQDHLTITVVNELATLT